MATFLRTSIVSLVVATSASLALGATFPVDGVFGAGLGCELYARLGPEGIDIDALSPAEEILDADLIERLTRDAEAGALVLTKDLLDSLGFGCEPLSTNGDGVTVRCHDFRGEPFDQEPIILRREGDHVMWWDKDTLMATFKRCEPPSE